MAAHDPSTSIQTVFALSRVIGAYPTTRKTMGYAIVNLTICSVVVSSIVVNNVRLAVNEPVTAIVNMILQHLESVEVSLVFFMALAAVTAYANYDMTSVMRSVYHIHNCIFKLGLVPVYRGKRGVFLLAISFFQILTEYLLTVKSSLDKSEHDMAILYFLCAFGELIVHVYTAQFFCLMEVLQDQIKALTSGLKHENQWYLESVVNVQCHLLKTTEYVYAMYVKTISMVIVHSTIAMMTHAFEIANNQSYVMASLIAFELIVILYVVDACGQMEFKVEDFNARLFKLMRLSKGLCENNKLYVFMTSKQTISFTACGFFTINYSLIVSIIAAVTTYLVILVQLSKPQEPVKFDD